MNVIANPHGAPKSSDWQDVAYYESLKACDRRHWAWLWSRRNQDNRRLSEDRLGLKRWTQLAPSVWFLKSGRLDDLFRAGHYVFPGKGPQEHPDARLFWRPDLDPCVIDVHAEPTDVSNPLAFDLARFRDKATVLLDPTNREMVLFSEGPRHLQLEVRSGTLVKGPVQLSFSLDGVAHMALRTQVLMRLSVLSESAKMPFALFPPARRGRWWSEALRAHDAECAGATQREIADFLYVRISERPAWKGQETLLKNRVRQLLIAGKKAINGDYLQFLL